jgi:hypothetical protein
MLEAEEGYPAVSSHSGRPCRSAARGRCKCYALEVFSADHTDGKYLPFRRGGVSPLISHEAGELQAHPSALLICFYLKFAKIIAMHRDYDIFQMLSMTSVGTWWTVPPVQLVFSCSS